MRYLIDAYAWIEYLEGSNKGKKVREILTSDNELYTLDLCIAEVISKIKRQQQNVIIAYKAITLNSKIISLGSEDAREGGLLHAEMHSKIKDFGLVDSLLLFIARKRNAKIITGDKHFKNMKEAVFLE